MSAKRTVITHKVNQNVFTVLRMEAVDGKFNLIELGTIQLESITSTDKALKAAKLHGFPNATTCVFSHKQECVYEMPVSKFIELASIPEQEPTEDPAHTL